MNAKYDVLVVGAGISGLLSALILGKEGKRVLLLEKENHIGGVCRSYNVQGYTVDTGPHIITRLDSGPLRTIMDKYFDIIPNFVPFGRYFLRINEQTKPFPWSIKEWMMFDLLSLEDRSLIMKSIIDIAFMVNSGKDMTKVSIKDITPKNLSSTGLAFLDYLSYFMLGTGPENAPVSRFIDRKDYKTENSIENNNGNFQFAGRLYNLLIGGKPTDQFYPKHGIQTIVDSINLSLPKNVQINLGEEVHTFHTENTKENGVSKEKITRITTNREEYTAENVVFSGYTTDLPQLISTPLPTSYLEKLVKIEKVNSLSIWLGLDKPLFEDMRSEMWVATSTDVLHTWLIPTSNYDSSLAPYGKHLVGFMFPVQDNLDADMNKKKAMDTIFNNVPDIEKYVNMIHVQELVPEKATWNMNAGFGDVHTPISNLFCVGSDSFKRSMGLTRASYSVLNMLQTLKLSARGSNINQ
jgi:phytoene dehydrogenase-like protein